ncbi:MAG: hypothetical protein AAF539_15995, partial [Planctomycetota bacterium]
VTTLGVQPADHGSWSPLPSPPGEPPAIANLLSIGKVRFITGDVRPSTVTGVKSTGNAQQRYDAETQFHLRYFFDGRCRYDWDGRELRMQVRYPKLGLLVDHEVWFRSGTKPTRTVDPTFWNLPLVRHELDHVRISSSSAVEQHFRDKVMDRPVLRYDIVDVRGLSGQSSIQPGMKLTAAIVRSLIDQHVRDQFLKIVELIEVRYRELDRVTIHGRRSIPEGHSIWQWMVTR